MAIRLICSSCGGRGYHRRLIIFKKTCVLCKGTGYFIEKRFNKIKSGKKLNKKNFQEKRFYKLN